INVFLSKMFEKEFPQEFKAYRKAHKAARWCLHDPGPYIGKAIVWKLSSAAHLDEDDGCLTVTYPMGSFTGGNMDIYDLHARLLYDAGYVILGFTDFLFHRVSCWKIGSPDAKTLEFMKATGVTPGRIRIVSFFSINTFNQVRNKESNWGLNTLWGR
ncbi:hypothetical protein K435DRAFT_611608, partial [Dendrothele bispora CBS 962.96]